MGNPITGNPANCHADPGGGLSIGGTVPGHTVPPGITTLGMLTIDNPSGVELLAPLQVENVLQSFRPFRMNDHALSGPGQVMILPVCIFPKKSTPKFWIMQHNQAIFKTE